MLPAFPENRGARLRISGGCPARGEPEALIKHCSSIACRAQPCQRCSPVLQALIYLSVHFYGSASAEPFFAAHFSGELGSTTAHLRRLPRKGRDGGVQNLCSSIACRAQPCQRCSPVLQALIIFQTQLYGSASAEPFFAAPFPENWGARLRISGGCPVRGEPEALVNLCSSIACRAQPCQRCSPVLQALIYLSMHFYGSASAEPFFAAPFPENGGARLRISGGCPTRGEPEALIDLCSSIAC